MEYNVPTFA